MSGGCKQLMHAAAIVALFLAVLLLATHRITPTTVTVRADSTLFLRQPLRPVVVGFCGYLNLAIPANGRLARRHMVDVLEADVVVAGSFSARETCSSRCLWERLRGLEPIAARSLAPKLSDRAMSDLVHRMPHFADVERAFRVEHTFHGVTTWAPVLGSAKAHMIHQIRDYALLLELLQRHETERGALYQRVVFSRLELVWLAPHPPLALLDDSLVWIPIGLGSPRMNDRHVVLNRHHAQVWLSRWELYQSEVLLDKLPVQSLAHDGPEDVIENLFIAEAIGVGEFPGTAFLPCCGHRDGCTWARGFCYQRPLSFCRPSRTSEMEGEAARQAARSNGSSRLGGCQTVFGKYEAEVDLAAAHASELQCGGGSYGSPTVRPPRVRSESSQRGHWICEGTCFWSTDGVSAVPTDIYRGRLPIVTSTAARADGYHPDLTTTDPGTGAGVLGHLEVEVQCTTAPSAGAMSWYPKATWAGVQPGYCVATITGQHGDCTEGDMGSWRMGSKELAITDAHACVRHCVRHCARCNYVSVSQLDADCSWYWACDMRALLPAPQTGHQTFAIRRGNVNDADRP